MNSQEANTMENILAGDTLSVRAVGYMQPVFLSANISVIGRSNSSTAASFVNLKSARPDPVQSFVEAVRLKYATQPSHSHSSLPDKPIIISTKEVQEVGFDKIRTKLAQLQTLRIVLVDGLGINKAEAPEDSIERDCPMIVELDLSRNLFDGWGEIVKICKKLNDLQTLKLK
jgi:tubulin-specific chaperone E